jgi:hypothetical protein
VPRSISGVELVDLPEPKLRRHLASNGSTGPAGTAGTLPELPLPHPVQLLEASIRGVPVALA